MGLVAAEQLTRHSAVFGDVSAAEVFDLIDRYVSDQLGTRVREILFDAGAIGAVFGLRLMDDRDVVIKAYQPAADLDRLVEVTRCQTVLNRRGFPCAAVIRPPCVIEGIPIVTEELRERTATGSPHDLATVDILAGGLARQIQLLRDVDGSGLTPGRPAWANWEAGAWPDPHHPIFDFTEPATGYEWLDEWADEHAAVLRDACKTLPYLIGHTDWVWQNVAVCDDRLAAGYDWDSLAFFPEAVVVGLSAGAFTQGSPTPPDAPRWSEVLAFLGAYQRRRARPSTKWSPALPAMPPGGCAATTPVARSTCCTDMRCPLPRDRSSNRSATTKSSECPVSRSPSGARRQCAAV